MSPYIIPGIRRNKYIPPQVIKNTICKYFEINTEDVEKRGRKKEVITSRRFCMYYMKMKTPLSLKSIGEQVGFGAVMAHSMAIHHINKVKAFVSVGDEKTIQDIKAIDELLLN